MRLLKNFMMIIKKMKKQEYFEKLVDAKPTYDELLKFTKFVANDKNGNLNILIKNAKQQ